MTARIAIHCDRMGRYGGCTSLLRTDATDVAEAEATAARLGWVINGTPDYCPRCSGQPTPGPAATVVELHPHTP
ncbi:hypothetical protein ACFWNQ_24930 [Streptomyces virginiae]|uniref:hypothetical protein n=1 Tax=Streptomyces virginiae TaxID=1961 RepID=UPI0036646022